MTEPSGYVLDAVKWMLSAVGAVALWLVRGWNSRMADAERRLLAIEQSYIGRTELMQHLERFEAKLDRLIERDRDR